MLVNFLNVFPISFLVCFHQQNSNTSGFLTQNSNGIPSLKPTNLTRKWKVGILLSFAFWGLASFQEVMFLNNDTHIPILLPYHSQREFLQVWEWYGKLSFRECTTTLALNSTSRSGSQRDEASNEDHED